MAWLAKRPQITQPSMFYTVGLNKTILIVGLGNPGKEYEITRHNIGFRALDKFVTSSDEFDSWTAKKDLKCLLTSARMGDKRVLAIKPTTFMNDSGQAIKAVSHFYNIDPTSILVIHDELDITFGQIRSRAGGSDAGHNGIKSVTEALGTDSYTHLRIGIGPKTPENIDSKNFVLSSFSQSETRQLDNLFREVSALLSEYIYSGNLPNETRSFII